MKWLVLGGSGTLGHDVVSVLRRRGHFEVDSPPSSVLNIFEEEKVNRIVSGYDIVINAAAWTDVDGAESDEGLASDINGVAVGNLAEACVKTGAHLIHVSTCAVLGGPDGSEFHVSSEDSPVTPINAYGRSKALGEWVLADLVPEHASIVRTSWLYGAQRKSFLTTILRNLGKSHAVPVVVDQIGHPTWTVSVAHRLIDLGQAVAGGVKGPGIYHAVSRSPVSYFNFTLAALRLFGLSGSLIEPAVMVEHPRLAAQRKYDIVDQQNWAKINMGYLPDWHEMLSGAIIAKVFKRQLLP